ncbi:MAG: aldehyde ferredoxin oxidoreductase N-terminal domain-containing protein [Candidatus Nanoarchaeia archaeon]|nr:glyceraldehyde-3-phosphate:ferredoxin oxidoreductase [Candidatus Jingweiarchaeum tengchongense]
MKAIYIDVENQKYKSEELNEKIIGPIDFAIYVHNKNKSHRTHAFNPKNAVCIGIGALAGSKIPGTHRLIFCTKSPLIDALFTSTLGGAGIEFYAAGLEFVSIEKKAKKPTIIIIRNINDKFEIFFETIEKEELLKIYKGYRNEIGTYALQTYLLEKFKIFYKSGDGFYNFRIITLGPSSLNTDMGAINSILIRNGEFQFGSEDWAGRGGFGSVLLRAHNVIGVIFGGNYDKRKFVEDLKDINVLNKIFNEIFGKNFMDVIKEATEKYRYEEKVKSGGTFGVNMSELGSWLPMFNWNSIYFPTSQRQALYDKFVKNNYLKQFNETIIETKNWKTCGEACPAVCKKYKGRKKKDYEAYEAAGPNCGIFDQDAAELAQEGIETMGFDAIEFGNLCSFILECLHHGLLKKEELGITENVNFDPNKFKLEDSFEHAKIVRKIAEIVAYRKGKFGKILAYGIRVASRKFDAIFNDRTKKIGIKFKDIANYMPYGKDGCIAPCQYWVPGFYIPLPIQGKFLTYYGQDFNTPEKLGEIAADRAVKELFSENTGICRFHRKWSEKAVEILLKRGCGIDVNYYEHCRNALQEILNYDEKANVEPIFWESKRTIDVIRTYINEVENVFGKNDETEYWKRRFEENYIGAAMEYWEKLLKGVDKILNWHKLWV